MCKKEIKIECKTVRFQYALYGRGKERGLLQRVFGEKIARGAIAVPVSYESEVKDFFKLWKVPFRKERILKAIKRLEKG